MIKKVLYIDLSNHKYEVKSVAELSPYIGGVGVGLKLLLDNIDKDPVVFSVGPLNGMFPYVSKTSIVFYSEGVVEDIYIGGSLSLRLKFSGIDSIVMYGRSKEPVILDIHNEEVSFKPQDTEIRSLGLPGKRSIIRRATGKFLLDEYFLTPELFLEDKLKKKGLYGMVITGSRTTDLVNINKEKYEELYHKLLAEVNNMTVHKDTYPSCSGCPVGCSRSRVGEIGGNVLVHSLVACTFAKNIYSNVGVLFSCLNVLGYDYTHEDIESLPALIENVLRELA